MYIYIYIYAYIYMHIFKPYILTFPLTLPTLNPKRALPPPNHTIRQGPNLCEETRDADSIRCGRCHTEAYAHQSAMA